MSKRLRMGIVGCGVIGNFHAKFMQSVESVELVAVADIIPERAEKLAAEYGIDWYDSLPAMLSRADIDAVAVCTPSGMHAEHGIAIAKAGKHVLSEKPLDVYIDKADALIATCREQGVTLGGIFQNRFPAVIRQVKQAIVDGYLGDIVFANASCLWLRLPEYYRTGDWRGTWALDAGVLSNQAIHTIDRLVWLTGMQPEVMAAYCPTLMREMEAEDLGVALLRFPNGAGGVIQGTTLAYPGLRTTVTIAGTKGSVIVEDNNVTFFKADGAPEGLVEVGDAESAGGSADPTSIWGGGHIANITEFANAILEGREPWVTGEEGRKAVALLNDIYRVARVGPWAEATV